MSLLHELFPANDTSSHHGKCCPYGTHTTGEYQRSGQRVCLADHSKVSIEIVVLSIALVFISAKYQTNVAPQ